MTEDIWCDIKPPKLFTKEFYPQVTARQIYITRILLEGTRHTLEDTSDLASSKKQEKTSISMNKKKSAVRFLSNIHDSGI